MPNRGPEVEMPAVAARTSLREAGRERTGQRVDSALEGEHLFTRRVHEVDVLGQRLAQGARHGLVPAVRHQAPADLRFDELLELPQPGLELLLGKTLGEL